jgi:hypothetical protein
VVNRYPVTSANNPMAIVGSRFQSLQSHPVGSTPPAWSRGVAALKGGASLRGAAAGGLRGRRGRRSTT